MVRNAYGMAIPEKNRRFSSRKINKKMKHGLKWVVRRAFRALTIAFFSNFFETNRLVIVPLGQTLLKKSF